MEEEEIISHTGSLLNLLTVIGVRIDAEDQRTIMDGMYWLAHDKIPYINHK